MWKQDVFFDIARFHLIFTYITILGANILGWFDTSFFTTPLFILALLDILFSGIVFSISREEHPALFQSFLLVSIFTGYIFVFLITHIFSFSLFIGFIGVAAAILFELMPRYKFFTQFLEPSKMFTLFLIILSVVGLLGWSFFDFSTLYIVVLLLVFLFSVHVRYSNYIAFGLAIFSLLFVYSKVFSAMITPESFVSTILFIFFLPATIIGNTYFWKEKYKYDFAVLHYSSITFSILFSIYAIFFIGW